ncbi:MAG: hypothetical protein AUI14_20295 [Actinobacteria bacterium 13_2_20CM_2_71_6]|nr:MAG: hypothetical protein AUI14_20295 [Actinobacteria bacterium 13_2_20CM_2_71_6]
MFFLQPTEVDFDIRGFRREPAATRTGLETSGNAFLTGFNLELCTPAGVVPDLSGIAPDRRGFGVEGAAMAACMLDLLRPFGGVRRLAALHDAYADRYVYLLHVGTGWALAKLHRTRPRRMAVADGLLGWLACDGWGFCRAFFASETALRHWQRHPAVACDPTCAIRYQGLGRSLWFRECGTPDGLARRVAQLPESHAGDVWSGIALAATYAGAVEPGVYPALRRLAGRHWPSAAQGAAFGAEAWRRCGHVPAHAVRAVAALAGTDVARAAEWTIRTRRDLDHPGASGTAYQTWRHRIQRLATEAG